MFDFRLLILLSFAILLMPIEGIAHCKGKHSNYPPTHCGGEDPPPPPVECTDTYPGFIYHVEATRSRPQELRLSSADGCRTEFLMLGGMSAAHATQDWSEGVSVWSDDSDNDNQYAVMKRDFTVDESRIPAAGTIVTLLPTADEIIPQEDILLYLASDIWGDATHDLLYMAVTRAHVFGPGREDVIADLLIYNLNNMADVRVIKHTAGSDWNLNCPDVDYPQFVPSCYYQIEGATFNQSGTRLYIGVQADTLQENWKGAARIDINRFDLAGDELPLADWVFSAPELVYTGPGDASGMLPRPDAEDRSDLPFPEHIGIGGAILDADLCAAKYAEFADGANNATADLWRDWCVLNGDGGGNAWQTADTILFNRRHKRNENDLYRRHIDTGVEELLIHNGQGADMGH